MKVSKRVRERVIELKRKRITSDEIKRIIEKEFQFKIFSFQIKEIRKSLRKPEKRARRVPFEFQGKRYELRPHLLKVFLIGERTGWDYKKMKKAGIKTPGSVVSQLRKIIGHPPYELTFKRRLEELRSKKSRKFAK